MKQHGRGKRQVTALAFAWAVLLASFVATAPASAVEASAPAPVSGETLPQLRLPADEWWEMDDWWYVADDAIRGLQWLASVGSPVDCTTADGQPGVTAKVKDDLGVDGTADRCVPIKMGLVTSPTQPTSTIVAPLTHALTVNANGASQTLAQAATLTAAQQGLGSSVLEVDETATDLPVSLGVPAGWTNGSAYSLGGVAFSFGTPTYDAGANRAYISAITSHEWQTNNASAMNTEIRAATGTTAASVLYLRCEEGGTGQDFGGATGYDLNSYELWRDPATGQARSIATTSWSCSPGLLPVAHVGGSWTVGTFQTAWYAPGHFRHTPGESGGLAGEFVTTVQCVSSSGTSTLTAVSPVADGVAEIPETMCPDGSVMGSFNVTFVPVEGDPVVVFDGGNPEWVTDIPTEFPRCIDGQEDCVLTLWQTFANAPSQFCGAAAVGCPEWWDQVQTHPDSYQCRYGSYSVDLSYCAIYREPGTISPTVAMSVDTAGNVTIGERLDTIERSAYDTLDDLKRQMDEWLQANQPQPQPTTPGTPIPQPSPIPEFSPDADGCWSTSWGVFNPATWVYRPIQCAFQWAFVPRTAVVAQQLDGARTALDDHGILRVVPAIATIPDSIGDGWDQGCERLGLDLNSDAIPTSAGIYIECSPTAQYGAGGAPLLTLRNIVGVMLGVFTAVAAFRLVRAHFGGRDAGGAE